MPGKPDLLWDFPTLHGFHRTCIQGSCQKNLIYHKMRMLLASSLCSGSVLPTLIPHWICKDFIISEFIQGSCQGSLICHRICKLLALNGSIITLSAHLHPPTAAVVRLLLHPAGKCLHGNAPQASGLKPAFAAGCQSCLSHPDLHHASRLKSDALKNLFSFIACVAARAE